MKLKHSKHFWEHIKARRRLLALPVGLAAIYFYGYKAHLHPYVATFEVLVGHQADDLCPHPPDMPRRSVSEMTDPYLEDNAWP